MLDCDASSLHETILAAKATTGYWKDVPIALGTCRTSGALTLTAGTNPTIGVSSHQAQINWAASDSAALHLPSGFTLPRNATPVEYNPATKRLGVNLALDMTTQKAGATDTVTFTASIYARTPGSATQKGPFTATASATNSGTYPTRLTFSFGGVVDASGYRLEPGDVIEEFSVTPSAHTTDAVFITSLTLRYKANVAFAVDTARFMT